jgi:hypothetical protein
MRGRQELAKNTKNEGRRTTRTRQRQQQQQQQQEEERKRKQQQDQLQHGAHMRQVRYQSQLGGLGARNSSQTVLEYNCELTNQTVFPPGKTVFPMIRPKSKSYRERMEHRRIVSDRMRPKYLAQSKNRTVQKQYVRRTVTKQEQYSHAGKSDKPDQGHAIRRPAERKELRNALRAARRAPRVTEGNQAQPKHGPPCGNVRFMN